MRKLKTLVSLFAAALIVSACQKDPVVQKDCSLTLNGLSGTYRLTALTYRAPGSSTEQDYLLFMDACERDDLVILKANGSWQYQDAGTSCAPSGNDNGTWSVTGNTISSDGQIQGTIRSYDCHTLVYYAENVVLPGDRYTFTMQQQ